MKRKNYSKALRLFKVKIYAVIDRLLFLANENKFINFFIINIVHQLIKFDEINWLNETKKNPKQYFLIV
jgi:hypothetical protein